jgi:hypothetical protein
LKQIEVSVELVNPTSLAIVLQHTQHKDVSGLLRDKGTYATGPANACLCPVHKVTQGGFPDCLLLCAFIWAADVM